METVKIKIDGIPVEVAAGTTILNAAKKAGVKIPTLCAHPDLEPWGACGICVVKTENQMGVSPRLVRACTTKVIEGFNYITHDPELQSIRKTVVNLILSNHPQECLTCGRNQQCELQRLAEEFCIREVAFPSNVRRVPKDNSTPSIVLDATKCIQCGRCAQVCQQLQGVWALEFIHRGENTRIAPVADSTLNESPCIKCGQCAAHCPVGAIYENDETDKFFAAAKNPELHIAVQMAPAVRVAVGEAFGMEPGEVVTGKIYAALRRLGAKAVFDTNFSADLTIMEEGSEFVKRFTTGGVLPQLTSCCPAWTNYMEEYYADMIPNFSTAKSPMMMQGAITKTYYAEQKGIDPAKIYSVAIMPCTAKKHEIERDDNMHASGYPDVDLVLTTRELARMIKMAGIDFANLPDEKADSPIGAYTGAATIFGVTGGVMEAAIRTAYKLVTNEELTDVNITPVRGMEGVKSAEVDIKGTKVRVAVAHGLANVKAVLDEVRALREAGKPQKYDFIEVMACRGGCIAGGGQPYGTDDDLRAKRTAGIYKDDEQCTLRRSHENPEIIDIYKNYLGAPLSEKSHHLLHTTYEKVKTYKAL